MDVKIIALAIGLLVAFGCIAENGPEAAAGTQETAITAGSSVSGASAGEEIKLRFIKFHGNSQCISCINLGKFANESLSKNYKNEMEAGIIEYLDINAETDTSNEFVLKYLPTHASLYLETTKNGKEEFEELMDAWYYTGDSTAYERYIISVVSEKMS